MSTRCNIVLKTGKSTVYLYRHYDGYLAETGADILQRVEAAQGDATAFLASLLDARSEPSAHRPQPPRLYQITTELHGDIEHLYVVSFGADNAVCIKHAARPRGWSVTAGDWTRAPKSYSVERFRQLVNAERAAFNARLVELRQTRPQAYVDCPDYVML